MNTNETEPAPATKGETPLWALYAVHEIETMTRLWVEKDEEDRAAAIITKHAAAISEEVERYRRHMREKIYVDATPDAELPARILSAHINESEYVSNPDTIGILMNDWQRERNKILRQALSDLTEVDTLRQWSEQARKALQFYAFDDNYRLNGYLDPNGPNFRGSITAQKVLAAHPAQGMEGRG